MATNEINGGREFLVARFVPITHCAGPLFGAHNDDSISEPSKRPRLPRYGNKAYNERTARTRARAPVRDGDAVLFSRGHPRVNNVMWQ